MKNHPNSVFLSSLTTSLNTFSYVLHNKKNRGVVPNTLWPLVQMLQPKTYIKYNYSRIRNVLIFVFFFWFLKSVWGRTGHQNRWKWHFYCFVLLFFMIHGSSRRILQFIAASFDVWGYRNRFLRSIMNVIQHLLNHSSQKKNMKPPLKFSLRMSN